MEKEEIFFIEFRPIYKMWFRSGIHCLHSRTNARRSAFIICSYRTNVAHEQYLTSEIRPCIENLIQNENIVVLVW